MEPLRASYFTGKDNIMAKKIIDVGIKLSKEDKKMLTDLDIDIQKAKKAVTLLKEMDVDTTSIEDKLAYTEKARNILLKDFV